MIFAVIASFLFGSYILPRKHSKLSVPDYQYWIAPIVPLVAAFYVHYSGSGFFISPLYTFFGFLCGTSCVLASVCYSLAIDTVGITRSTFVKNTGPIFATTYGIFLFHEFTLAEPLQFSAAVLGSILMIAAAVVIANTKSIMNDSAHAFQANLEPSHRKKLFALGYTYAFLTGFFYSVSVIPLRRILNEGYNSYQATFWMGVGFAVSTLVSYIVIFRKFSPRRPNIHELVRCNAAGFIWITACCFAVLSMSKIPMSITWPITNLSALVTLSFGVLYFKEVNFQRCWKKILMSCLCYVAGLFLLKFALIG